MKPDSTWVWELTRVDDGATRLVTRVHAVYDWRHPVMAVVGVVLMEFGDFPMMRRMLRGIKTRAETAGSTVYLGSPQAGLEPGPPASGGPFRLSCSYALVALKRSFSAVNPSRTL